MPSLRTPRPATMNVLTIPSRFNGPAGVGNGGYVCGRIAAYVDGPATVTLRQAAPAGHPDGGRTRRRRLGPCPARPHADRRGRPVAGRPAGDTGHGVARRGRRGRPGGQVLRRSGVSRLLRLRDEPRSRRRAADLSRTGEGPGLVGGAVDAGSFGRRFRREGAGRGGLGRARLPERYRRRRGGRPGRRGGLGHRHPARPDDGRHPGAAARGRRQVPRHRLAAPA